MQPVAARQATPGGVQVLRWIESILTQIVQVGGIDEVKVVEFGGLCGITGSRRIVALDTRWVGDHQLIGLNGFFDQLGNGRLKSVDEPAGGVRRTTGRGRAIGGSGKGNLFRPRPDRGAFQSDLTRVFAFQLGRDASARVYPESGVGTAFHSASHHGGREDRVLDFAKINEYHVSMVPYLMQQLQDTMDGDANLLDKSLIVYGSAMADSNLHNHRRCPLFLAGGANGKLPGGLHVRAETDTPMANVMLTMLQRMGMNDLESFGDSNGEFSFDVPETATESL